jgi:hypothetical protein
MLAGTGACMDDLRAGGGSRSLALHNAETILKQEKGLLFRGVHCTAVAYPMLTFLSCCIATPSPRPLGPNLHHWRRTGPQQPATVAKAQTTGEGAACLPPGESRQRCPGY